MSFGPRTVRQTEAEAAVGVQIMDLGGSLKDHQKRVVRDATREWGLRDWLRMQPNIHGWLLIVFALGVAIGRFL